MTCLNPHSLQKEGVYLNSGPSGDPTLPSFLHIAVTKNPGDTWEKKDTGPTELTVVLALHREEREGVGINYLQRKQRVCNPETLTPTPLMSAGKGWLCKGSSGSQPVTPAAPHLLRMTKEEISSAAASGCLYGRLF